MASSGSKFNVVFIMSDQHSQGVCGCYGHDVVRTPYIDGLAQRGLVYDNAFCCSPLCGPSRMGWLTGTHPHTNGVVTHNNDRHKSRKVFTQRIRPGIGSLVSCFRDSGYNTYGSGFLHAERFAINGFEELGFGSYGADESAYEKLIGSKVCRRYNMANTISEMWEHTYRNVEG